MFWWMVWVPNLWSFEFGSSLLASLFNAVWQAFNAWSLFQIAGASMHLNAAGLGTGYGANIMQLNPTAAER